MYPKSDYPFHESRVDLVDAIIVLDDEHIYVARIVFYFGRGNHGLTLRPIARVLIYFDVG